MTSPTLDTDIELNSFTGGKPASGFMILTASETVKIDKISCKILLEIRGRIAPATNSVASGKIIGAKTLTKGETYRIPFSFDTKTFKVDTYEGRNVSFKYRFEGSIHVNEADQSKLKLGFLNSIKAMIQSDKTFKVSKYFEVDHAEKGYAVVPGTYVFKIGDSVLLPILIAVLFIPIAVYAYSLYSVKALFGVAVAFVIGLTYFKDLRKKQSSSIKMELQRETDGFSCKIKKSRNFVLKDPALYYRIIEKVDDNRGSRSNTMRSIMYLSDEVKIHEDTTFNEEFFSFPFEPDMETAKVKDASIEWEMTLTGRTSWGFTKKFTAIFKVQRLLTIDTSNFESEESNYKRLDESTGQN